MIQRWMTRLAGIAMGGVLLTLSLTACAEQKETTSSGSGKIPVTMMHFNQLPAFEALVEKTYGDIDLVVEQNTSATLDNESERRLQNNHGSHLIMTTLPGGVVKNYTYDLSAESFVLDYSSAITKTLLIDGETHYVPLPGQYYGYLINKTLVEELGFSLPTTNEELYAILDAAQKRKLGVGENGDCMGFYNIGENYLANLIFGNAVPDYLSTPDGIIWLSDLQEGKAKFSGNFEQSMDFILSCVSKGYFDAGTVLSSSSVTISNRNAVHVQDRMLNRTMVMAYGDMELYQRLIEGESTDTFTMIPFLSNGENPGWLISIGSGYLAVNKALAQKGQEHYLDAALRVLALLSTPEGQSAMMEDTHSVFSYLEGAVPSQQLPEGIQKTVEQGFVFNSTLPNNIAQYFGRQMNLVISGKTPLAQAMSAVDNYGREGFTSSEQAQTVVGVVSGNFLYENYNTRREETAIGNLIADAVREYSGADIALVNGGGIRSSLYEGEVWDADLAAVCPYGNLIITVQISGSALREAIANGITQTNRGESVPGGRFLQVSGLHYTFRPMKNEKDTGELKEVTLPDGTPISDDQQYLVAITNYMAGSSGYAEGNGDGFVMLNVYDGKSPKTAVLVQETGGTYRDALKAYFDNRQGEKIAPVLDGRISTVQ